MIKGLSINRNTFYYGLGLVMMKGIAFLMLPVYTHYLSPYEYGQLEMLVTYANLISLILGMGLIEGLYRFASTTEDKERRRVMSTTLVLTGLLSILFILLVHVTGAWLAELMPGDISVQHIFWISVSLALGAVVNIPLTWLRMHDRAATFFRASIFMASLQGGLSFFLLTQGYGVLSIILSGVTATILVVTYLIWGLRKDFILKLEGATVRRLLRYGWPFIISGFAGFILSGADRWLLADLSDMDTLAIYAIAAKFAFVPVMLMQPYALWWYPKRFSYLGSPEKLSQNAHHAIKGAVYAVALCGVTGLVAPIVIRFMTPVTYHDAIIYLPTLLTAIALKICSEYLNIGCFIGERSYLQMAIDILVAIVAFIMMWSLRDNLGVMGIILALNVAYLLRLILFYLLSQRALYLPYKLRPLLSASLVSSGLIIMGQWTIRL